MLARAKGAAPGTFTGGRIVNIASMAGLRVLGQIGVYAISKAAVIHMTRRWRSSGGASASTSTRCARYIDTEINHHHWQTEQGKR
jgi:NAD(P)-dependent dehydrogenase (short-subunit alcohol dehydrogenase family)